MLTKVDARLSIVFIKFMCISVWEALFSKTTYLVDFY